MKTIKTWSIAILVLALALFGFSGCEDATGSTTTTKLLSSGGTWVLDSSGASWTSLERWTITDSTITYESNYGSGYSTVYEADIIYYSNTGLNAADTEISLGGSQTGLGHAVICYTYVSGASTGEVGKYNIFRWATNETSSSNMDFAQGYYNIGGAYPDNVNGVFDTAAEAISGATNAAGYFDYGSAGASLQ